MLNKIKEFQGLGKQSYNYLTLQLLNCSIMMTIQNYKIPECVVIVGVRFLL